MVRVAAAPAARSAATDAISTLQEPIADGRAHPCAGWQPAPRLTQASPGRRTGKRADELPFNAATRRLPAGSGTRHDGARGGSSALRDRRKPERSADRGHAVANLACSTTSSTAPRRRWPSIVESSAAAAANPGVDIDWSAIEALVTHSRCPRLLHRDAAEGPSMGGAAGTMRRAPRQAHVPTTRRANTRYTCIYRSPCELMPRGVINSTLVPEFSTITESRGRIVPRIQHPPRIPESSPESSPVSSVHARFRGDIGESAWLTTPRPQPRCRRTAGGNGDEPRSALPTGGCAARFRAAAGHGPGLEPRLPSGR